LTSQRRKDDLVLPNVLIIGAMKSGTTALHLHLRKHPQVFASRPKELNFFVEEHNWNRGQQWYEAHFREADGAMAIIETSPQYTKAPEFVGVPERISRVIPNARLVYLVRDPIARIRSAYLHYFARGREDRSIEQALREDDRYLDQSRYGYQLDQYLPHFARDQILVLRAEDLWSASEESLHDLYRFIRIDPAMAPHRFARKHATSDKLEPHVAVRSLRRAADPFRHLLPVGIKRRLLSVRARPIDTARGAISADTVAWLQRSLTPDVHRLREIVGPTFRMWEWAR
jgi:hypothetical protein